MGQGTSSRHKTTDLGKSESTLEFEPGKKLISPSQQSFDRGTDRSLIDRGNKFHCHTACILQGVFVSVVCFIIRGQ